MVYTIAGVIVVLLGILIWLNVYWARQLPKQKVHKKRRETAVDKSADGANESDMRSDEHRDGRSDGRGERRNDGRGDERSDRHDRTKHNGEERDRHWHEKDTARENPPREEQGHPSRDAEPDVRDEQNPVEVLQSDRPHSSDSVFGQSRQPYYLNEINVPDFARPQWVRSFTYLKDHAGVLGWIAFSEDTVGAADRKYDKDFLDALRSYRQSTDRLQQQVGLSRVVETSIVGDEGKVWLLTVVDNIWFALFVDREVDSWVLTQELLQAHANG